MESHKYSRMVGEKKWEVELTNWAQHANGSVLVRVDDTMVLATAVMGTHPREGGDFFPLMVDYEEKYYAAGRILGSRFIKRETRPSEEAILVSRLIDRAIRPRFSLRMRNEVQVIVTVLSIDDENDPDIMSLFAASLALSLSNIPWAGPVAAVRVGRNQENGGFIVNPTYTQRLTSDLDAVVAGTRERINMLEVNGDEISESDFARGVVWGEEFIKELVAFQDEVVAKHAPIKATVPLLATPPEWAALMKSDFFAELEQAVYTKNKTEMRAAREAVRERWHAHLREKFSTTYLKGSADFMFEDAINEIVHARILEKGERPDGRKPDELRAIRAAVGVLPRTHGSGMFMRGETHVLSSLTLGGPGDEQIVEGMEIRMKKRFLHHYNFPPFSVGEVKPLRGPGRRDIGHGALAGRALFPLIPTKEEFPYTIRLVSEVLSSNGSSSMASVCGSILALMDAGVPIKKAAAGTAMGLMMDEQGRYVVLTDIQGPEDHHGDMDFKVAGTRDGITAVQMDVKIEGITPEIIKDTLTHARRSRLQILDVMETTISAPRPELSPWAPRVTTIKISPEKIGALIGPGGKMINAIIAETGAQIDIENDGSVFVTSVKAEGMERALALIRQVTREIKAGELLEGPVTRLFEFGAMVEIGPRQEGLIHISELAPWRVERVTDIIQQGDIVPVMVKNIDDQGRVNLSLKDVPDRYSDADIERARQENAASSHSGPTRNGGFHHKQRRPDRFS